MTAEGPREGMPLVRAVEVLRIALPFDAGRRPDKAAAAAGEVAYNAASPALSRMEALLVKVTTDDGRTGWGEGFGHAVNPVTFAALTGLVGPFFLGAAADPAATGERAARALHAFGRTGPVAYALSAMDIALWDLAAQRAGRPLRHLLAEGARDRIEAYASLPSHGNDPAEVAHQVRRAHEEHGFTAVKLHETEYTAIAAARAALPAGAALMVDVNCPWPYEEARRRIERLRELDLAWIEEPLWPPDDLAALARLRACGVPVAAGENASGPAAFAQHFAAGAVDVAQPSVAKIGGVSGALEVVAAAAGHGVRVVPHCFYYGPGLLAAAQLVAALPEGTPLEVPFLRWPRPLHPAQCPVPVLDLPAEPGLGFAPDPRVVEEHLVERVVLG